MVKKVTKPHILVQCMKAVNGLAGVALEANLWNPLHAGNEVREGIHIKSPEQMPCQGP